MHDKFPPDNRPGPLFPEANSEINEPGDCDGSPVVGSSLRDEPSPLPKATSLVDEHRNDNFRVHILGLLATGVCSAGAQARSITASGSSSDMRAARPWSSPSRAWISISFHAPRRRSWRISRQKGVSSISRAYRQIHCHQIRAFQEARNYESLAKPCRFVEPQCRDVGALDFQVDLPAAT